MINEDGRGDGERMYSARRSVAAAARADAGVVIGDLNFTRHRPSALSAQPYYGHDGY